MTPNLRPVQLGARWLVLGPLAVGPDGEVWRALDTVTDAEVALRMLPPGPPPPSWRRLRGLQHPGLAPVVAMGVAGGARPWIATAPPEGRPLGVEYAARTPPAVWAARVAAMLDGLSLLHDRGLTHGRFRPAHVVVPDSDPVRAVIIDLGNAVDPRPSETLPGWSPPEPEPTPRAADLWALSMLAATALLGRLPPAGAAAASAIGGAPHPLLRWLDRMLDPSSTARPESAEAALDALEAAAGQSLRTASMRASRAVAAPPSGRDDLAGHLADRLRQGGLCVLIGPPGSGRSVLLDAVADRVLQRAPAIERVELGADPSRAMRGVIAALTDAGRGEPMQPPTVSLSDDPHELSDRLLAWEGALRERASIWLGGGGPLLVDDVDPGTFGGRLLLDAASRSGTGRGVAIVLSDAMRSFALRALSLRDDRRDMLAELPPLGLDAIAQWLHGALGMVERPFALAARLSELTDGHPRALRQTLDAALGGGALHKTDGRYQWDREALPAPPPPTGERPQHPDAARRALRDGDFLAAAQGFAVAAPPEGPALTALIELALGRPEAARVAAQAACDAAKAQTTADLLAATLLAEACVRSGDPAAALQTLDGSWAAIDGQASPILWARATLVRAEAALSAGRIERALSALQGFDDRLPAGAPPTLSARAAQLRAGISLQRNDRRTASVLRHTLAGLPESLPAAERARIELLIGRAERAAGRHEVAVGPLSLALDRLIGLRLHRGAIDAARALAVLRYEGGDWQDAMAAWERVAELGGVLGSVADVAAARNNLGALARDMGQLDSAGEHLEEALRLARIGGADRVEILAMTNLGDTWARMGDLVLAGEELAEAAEVAGERGAADLRADALRRLAALQVDQGDDDTAEATLWAARDADARPSLAAAMMLDGLESLLRLRRRDAGALDRLRALARALSDAGNPLESGRLLLRAAEIRGSDGSTEEAEALLAEADQRLVPLQARSELSRADELRRRLATATRHTLRTISRHYDTLQELALALARERDIAPLLELILQRALDLVGEERGFVQLFDEAGLPGLRVERLLSAEPLPPVRQKAVARAIETRKPVILTEGQAIDIDGPSPGSLSPDGLSAVLCVPIVRADELLGIIYVDGRTAVDGAAEMQAELLHACADAAAVAIENARLIEALRRKQEAIAILAHELRAPLTSIVGFASLLMEDDPTRSTAEDHEMAGVVKSEAERLSAMVGRVLELARMQAAPVEWERSAVDPLSFLVAASDSLRPLARQAEVVIQLDAAADVPDVLGDEGRLVQVMVNLIGNAIKFSPQGGRVGVHASREGAGLLVRVVDDGPGVPPERLRAIFEPYQQAGSPRMRSKGVGLGLAISEAIVRQHAGRIEARNREGGGAEFLMWLPSAGQSDGAR